MAICKAQATQQLGRREVRLLGRNNPFANSQLNFSSGNVWEIDSSVQTRILQPPSILPLLSDLIAHIYTAIPSNVSVLLSKSKE